MRLIVIMALLLTTSYFSNFAMAKIDVQTLTLQRSYLQAIDCRAQKQLTIALENALKNSENLTAKGNNASILEEIMIHNPACFIQALNALPKTSCKQFAAEYINETFFYPRSAINESLSGAKEYGESCIAG